MIEPIAVLLSDVHYDLNTLELADAATRLAISTANQLELPLIVAGDLHNTKANVRGECIKRMRETFKLAKITPRVLRGNHDQINEKSTEHSLLFLEDLVVLIDQPTKLQTVSKLYGIPYHHDVNELKSVLKAVPKDHIVIMHQGLIGSEAGEYIVDKSAITYDDVKELKVVSGHYHKRQTIPTGAGNTFSYIGNPYTLTFAEATDPEKGFQILYADGTMQFVSTNLRKHVKFETSQKNFLDNKDSIPALRQGDLLWVVINEVTERITKQFIAKRYNIETDFRLDLIPPSTKIEKPQKQLKDAELIDTLILSMTNVGDEQKNRLINLWKNL